MVISTTGGASAGSTTAGGEVGLYSGAGRLRYGVSAVVTGGASQWAGGLLGARWNLLDAGFTPYLGAGIGIFAARRDAVDLGVHPTAAFDAGVEWRRFFAGARVLLPLTRTEGVRAHDVAGFGDAAVLGQLGFRI